MEKYSDDGPFTDPIVRCCDCKAIVTRVDIKKLGMCGKCGNKRVRKISVLSETEMKELKENGVDPVFLALFGEIDEA